MPFKHYVIKAVGYMYFQAMYCTELDSIEITYDMLSLQRHI